MANIMDEPIIEEVKEPILRPTRYVPRRGPPILIYRNFNRFADWIVSLVPEPIRRRVDRRIREAKNRDGKHVCKIPWNTTTT